MGLELIPEQIFSRFRFSDYGHACAILAGDFPSEWDDILACLDQFRAAAKLDYRRWGRPIKGAYRLGWVPEGA
jgi:hypothetical protein